MNRQEALEWCVENIDEWTSIDLHIHTKKSLPLHWRIHTNPVRLVNHETCTQIEAKEWLEAKTIKGQTYMPEVGEECEFSYNSKPFRSAKYIGPNYVGSKTYLVLWVPANDGEECGKYDNFKQDDNINFRPLRTEEEIKRDCLSDSIVAIFEQHEADVSKACMADLLDLLSQ